MYGDDLEIPSHVFKITHEDNDRTRLLKDVLHSSMATQEKKPGQSQTRQMGSNVMAANKPRKDRTRRSMTAVSIRELANCQETDMVYCDMAGAGEDSLPLLSCSGRISNLYKKVHASEIQLRSHSMEADVQEQARQSNEDPADDVRIVSRPEDDKLKTSMRARSTGMHHKDGTWHQYCKCGGCKIAVWKGIGKKEEDIDDPRIDDFIAKHARFPKVEELQEKCEKSDSFEGLRAFIPRSAARHQQHPNLVLLDRKVLDDPAKLQRAIWSTAPVQAEAVPSNSLRNRRLGKAKARINMQVDTAQFRRGSSGMRSAPAL